MKKLLMLGGLLLLQTTFAMAQQKPDRAVYDLVPTPVSMIRKPGFFQMTDAVRIAAPAALKDAAMLLAGALHLPEQNKMILSGTVHGRGVIHLALRKDPTLGSEGYHLSVSPTGIQITGSNREGVIHGLFTLVQLQEIQTDENRIPCLKISDTPRFTYRGMHLDVSRHFFPVSFIKKFIDVMALYKFNTFHWHLTDGAGWRLQIKKYPLLTLEGAWRTRKNLSEWWKSDRHYSRQGAPDAYGGYYTTRQAKEVVKYAAQRGITVIPEIEMPAHSEEVLACYPELSCSGKPYKNAEFCIGNDSTFTFLEDVLTEVMRIFPSKYIHIGGDEASKTSWKTCPKDQALMKRLGLKNGAELQSYFVNRIGKFLHAHGRKLLGWDEILEGGTLAPGATVMSWRGEAGGIAATRQGHDVVMTPGAYCYFDHYQSDPNTQPYAIGGYTPLSKVYGYDPVPADSLSPAEQNRIIGVQANLWTEYMPTTEQVEYMAFPRMLALSEVAWTAPHRKNFDDFHRRLQSQYLLLQRHNVNYYRPSYRVHISALPDDKKKENLVSFSTEQYQPVIRYTTNGSTPDRKSPVYTKPFYVKGRTTVKAIIFKDGLPMDSVRVFTANYHKAIGKKITYNNGGWSSSYPAAGASTLTDGITGGLTYQDKKWQGFLHDIDVTVDMGGVTTLNSLSIRFMQLKGPGVYMPGSVTVLLSDDGKNFKATGAVQNDISPKDSRLLFKTFTFDLKGKSARFIRVKAPNVQDGFMFTDEIMVN
ncbi:MAG TPA: family 20 glycosylhydrolase [Chitinophagaceae bacterium]|nr:family 20 glycosylhydrolase [Chitinophagaceae bacterium]